MTEEIKFVNLEEVDFSAYKSWEIQEILKDFLTLFSEKHSNADGLGHEKLPRSLPKEISQALEKHVRSLKPTLLEEITEEWRKNRNSTFNNIVNYLSKQDLQGIDDLLQTYFFNSEADPKIKKNIKTLFKFLGLRTEKKIGESGLFYFKSNYFRFFEDLSISGEKKTREIMQKHFLIEKEMEELHQALIEIFEKIKDLRSKEKLEKEIKELDRKKVEFTKEKAEQDSKNQATKQYSINLAKFFGDEIERLAGKSGLPRSFTPCNDKEKSSEIEKLESKVCWLRTLVYAIPVLAMFCAFLCENLQSNWHFWLALFSFFAISSYHLTQSIRESNVLKSMAASYRHRYIVAETFASFVDNIAKTHPEMKDIITKEAALAMFKRDSTGYLSKNQIEPSNTPVQEIIGVVNRGK